MRTLNFVAATTFIVSAAADWSRGGLWFLPALFLIALSIGPLVAAFSDDPKLK